MEDLGLKGALQSRQARPLNGLEIREAIESHILSLTSKMLNNQHLNSDEVVLLTEELKDDIREEFSKQSRLSKLNVTYPGVGWNIKTRLEQLDNLAYLVNAEVELDLDRNVRLNIQFGQSGVGTVVSSLEEEKIPTNIPDRDRKSFGLPIEVEHVRSDGTVGRIDLNKMEKRAARTVDVGQARTAEVATGAPVILPSELPEVILEEIAMRADDIVGSPPELERAPLDTPLPPPNSMSHKTRPDAMLKKPRRHPYRD